MEFVPFEIAKKLEEKGFILGYNLYGYKPVYTDANTIKFIWNIGAYEKDYFGENIPCPTISEVLKWLRDTHNIHINVGFVRFNGNTELYWVFSVENINDDIEYDWLYSTSHDSYEEAAMAGIEWVLDNIL